jgi:2-alkenal reductase
MDVSVTLAARPGAEKQTEQEASNAWLGIIGLTLTSEIADSMGLPTYQKGVLVEQVYSDSPADKAGLRGSYKPETIGGQQILVGGDIITAVDGEQVKRTEDLQFTLQRFKPGQEVTLTLLRNGDQIEVEVTLDEHPEATP